MKIVDFKTCTFNTMKIHFINYKTISYRGKKKNNEQKSIFFLLNDICF